jgi:hypothetical protein
MLNVAAEISLPFIMLFALLFRTLFYLNRKGLSTPYASATACFQANIKNDKTLIYRTSGLKVPVKKIGGFFYFFYFFTYFFHIFFPCSCWNVASHYYRQSILLEKKTHRRGAMNIFEPWFLPGESKGEI